jgi:hypothetical protein
MLAWIEDALGKDTVLPEEEPGTPIAAEAEASVPAESNGSEPTAG